MASRTGIDQPRFRAYGRRHLDRLPEINRLSIEQRAALKAVSSVLPFRVNDYVLRELIDWDDIPNDPIYQLTFPQAGMLELARYAIFRFRLLDESLVVAGTLEDPLECVQLAGLLIRDEQYAGTGPLAQVIHDPVAVQQRLHLQLSSRHQ